MKQIMFGLLVLLVICLLLLGALRIEEYKENENAVQDSSYTTESALSLVFLDIGQGDATFVTFPDGTQLLIDCAVDARILEALGRVMPFYDKTIDYLLITHPDKDHYGGCEDVLDRFDVEHIVYTGVKKTGNKSWESYTYAQYAEGADYQQIDRELTWTVGSSTLHFLYPDHPVDSDSTIPGQEADTGVNNTSIVLLLSYAETTVLLPGDAEAPLEAYLLQAYGEQLDVDILKVGHHGSAGSSAPEFLDIVSPDHAIISSGAGNSYGHPSRRVLKRLDRVSSTIWRTDQNGDILVSITPDNTYVGSYSNFPY
jgi:competence protein ComEC